MSTEANLALAFAVAVAGSLALVPLAIRVAMRTDFLDRPVGYKAHVAPTPYLGGAAVMLACALGTAVAGVDLDELAPVIGLAAILAVVGTIDDRRFVSPWVRVLIESAAAAILWAFGLGWEVAGSDAVDLVLSVVWIVGVVNAFNLMDNMDGTAAACGTASSLGIAGLAIATDHEGIAVLAIALAGACIGFLPFNVRSPARIFLGDGGSMPIGFATGALAMACHAPDGKPAWAAALAAVLLVWLPLTDIALVMISRRRRGLSVLTGGRDHMTHRLLYQLGSARVVALAVAIAQASLGFMAIFAFELGGASVVWVAVGCVLLAGTAIVVMETGALALAPAGESVSLGAASREAAGVRETPWRGLVAGVFGLACGASAFVGGFYSFSVWGSIALGLLVLALALLLAGQWRPSGIAVLALGGLLGLAVTSLLSLLWAESADRALIAADRWILYAAGFAVLLAIVRNERIARAGLVGVTAGVCGVAGYVLIKMVGLDGASLFVRGRLGEPLGYVNSQGMFFILGFWPLIAVAQYARSGLAAGLGAAGATALASLMMLTEARSVALAFVASLAIVMAFVPGRIARVWLILLVVAAVAAISPQLIDIFQAGRARAGDFDAVIRDGAGWLIAVSALAGLGWALIRGLAERLPVASVRRVALTALALVAVAAATVGLVKAGSIGHRVDSEVTAFTELQPNTGRTRLLSGGGNRYDYWRISANEFSDHPVGGVGAGNYGFDYYKERRTREDIRQPHSVEFQALAELGLLGVGGLALFLVAVGIGAGRRLRARPLPSADRALALAAVGMFSAWMAHASADWSHLLPGATGAALVAAAYLVLRPSPPPAQAGEISEDRGRPSALALAGLAAICVMVAAGAVAIGRPLLALHYRTEGQAVLARAPTEALAKANDSLALDDQVVETWYLKSAAYAALNDYRQSSSALREATKREPHNFVPWALLGDLATRRGDTATALVLYRHAASLNPRDRTLRKLARRPAGRASSG